MRARAVALTVVFIGGAALADPPGAPPGGALTLEAAIQLAMTRNERAAVADLNVVSAEAGVSKARVALMPVLSAKSDYNFKPLEKTVNALDGSLTVSQPIYAPSAYPLYDQAKELLAAQRAQSTDDKRTLAFDAAHAYLQVLLAEDVVKSAQEKLDTAKAELADTQAQQKAALVSSNDVTRAQIDLASSQREIATDQGALDAALVQLAFTINAPAAAVSPPDALLADASRPASAPEQLVAHAIAMRPDLVAKKHAAIAAHDFALEPRRRFLPTLGVQGSVNGQSSGTQSGHDYDATAQVTATWTIWDGGARDADAEARDASAEIADLATDTLVRTIDAQVRTAAAQLLSAQQTLIAARDAMVAAQKSAQETAILYKQGLARAIELVDANESRFEAEVSYASAEFSVETAYLALRQTVGLDPIGGGLP